jgi:HK97 family phage major capsid protein
MNVNELNNMISQYSEALNALHNEDANDSSLSKAKRYEINKELDNLELQIKRPVYSNVYDVDEKNKKFQMQYKNAFVKYLRKGIDVDLLNLLNNNQDGMFDSNGFAITPDMKNIISSNMMSNSPIRKLSRVVNVSRDSVDVAVYKNDISAVWGDDRTVAPETDAFERKTIKVCELTAQPKITQKMIDDDAVDHESWIAELLSDILLEKEDEAFLYGDGINKPKGMLSYQDGNDENSIERINGGNSVSFENLLQLQASLDGKYERAGETAFITSKKTLAKIRSIKDESGHYIWTPGALIGKEDCIFGTPIFATSAMQEGEDAVIYGNLRKGYQIVDRNDIKIQRDPYSSKPFVVFFATKRVGGDVIDPRAIKVLKIG